MEGVQTSVCCERSFALLHHPAPEGDLSVGKLDKKRIPGTHLIIQMIPPPRPPLGGWMKKQERKQMKRVCCRSKLLLRPVELERSTYIHTLHRSLTHAICIVIWSRSACRVY